MLTLSKTINHYLKYPLMWVMLLWAITLPGHEVIVYDFLLKVISGAPTATLANPQEAISRAEKQKNTSYVYLEAAPASYSGKFVSQCTHFISVESGFSFNGLNVYISSALTTYCTKGLRKALLLSVLPNAP
jgi:hypothetical protein